MTSKPVAQLLVDLGVARSHSRPHVSNDNPYSEANFKTLKYCPAFPGRFGSIQDARAFCALFFDHYNHVHRHAAIGLHTPASVHYGTAPEIRAPARRHPRRRLHRQPLPVPPPPPEGLPPLRLTGGVERFSGCLGVGGQEFELYGSESAKATLAAASMVGPFDPGDDGEAEFFSGLPALAVEDVLLEQ